MSDWFIRSCQAIVLAGILAAVMYMFAMPFLIADSQ